MIHNLKINKETINLNEISQFMLTAIKQFDTKQSISKNNTINLPNVPSRMIKINYVKKYSKYNEPTNINNINQFKDKLFWCFYKLLNNLEDVNLEQINKFETEKTFKFNTVEKLKNNKQLLKNNKMKKTTLEDDLINNTKITLKTFQGLCLIYKINIVLIKNAKLYTVFGYDDDDTKKSITCENYNIIEINYNNNYNDFDINIINKITKDDLEKKLTALYFVDDLEKPFKSITNYKLNELLEIANKFKIDLSDIKKPRKQDLYSLIMKNL